ncbi:hypothetical protein B0J11DRAFT_53332 [Dendryphion nanum]|uniref:DUF7703 domain-containing protein n=1 Tax=Dendryphion nanum TaxID=256645 RepID=A0A9P9DL41_9PLEO|nr:hypothetical protein B0J11DRAFT_53332 [Dendryphion nanum]
MDSGPSLAILKNLPVFSTMSAFIGISLYIGLELNIRLFMTFKRWRGLYFWSCLLCSWGIICSNLIGIFLDFGIIKNPWGTYPIIYLAWGVMVVGQSFVLYSRLHLVMENRKHLRWVLIMVTTTGIGIAIPTIVIGLVRLTNPSLIMDRIQVSTFFAQEVLLSTLYVLQTRKYLRTSRLLGNNDKSIHRVLQHLVYTNLLILFLDVTIIVLSFVPGIFYVQAALKPCVYGVKLRIEFSILNKLVDTVKRVQRLSTNSHRTSSQLFVGTPWKQDVENPKRPSLARIESFSCRPSRESHGSQDPVIEGGIGLDLASRTSLVQEGIVQTTNITILPDKTTKHTT